MGSTPPLQGNPKPYAIARERLHVQSVSTLCRAHGYTAGVKKSHCHSGHNPVLQTDQGSGGDRQLPQETARAREMWEMDPSSPPLPFRCAYWHSGQKERESWQGVGGGQGRAAGMERPEIAPGEWRAQPVPHCPQLPFLFQEPRTERDGGRSCHFHKSLLRG